MFFILAQKRASVCEERRRCQSSIMTRAAVAQAIQAQTSERRPTIGIVAKDVLVGKGQPWSSTQKASKCDISRLKSDAALIVMCWPRTFAIGACGHAKRMPERLRHERPC